MGTMHQLIVFFCGLLSHSSSALVVIFLSEFTLEEQRLFKPANIFCVGSRKETHLNINCLCPLWLSLSAS